MKQFLRAGALGVSLIITAAAVAAEEHAMPFIAEWQETPERVFDASEVDLDALVWVARPLMVFADSANDPQFRQQMEFLADRAADLAERDVIIITDTDPAARSDVRLRLRPRGFMLALIGKDGEIKLRKPAPWDVRELTRSIDKMPLRQQEIRDRRSLGQ